jgi:hypothetical protein
MSGGDLTIWDNEQLELADPLLKAWSVILVGMTKDWI